MTEKSPLQILEEAYALAQTGSTATIPDQLYTALKMIADNAEDQKAVLGAVTTSLTYKIWRPDQDIRYHQEQMPNGYSARTFDANDQTECAIAHNSTSAFN